MANVSDNGPPKLVVFLMQKIERRFLYDKRIK